MLAFSFALNTDTQKPHTHVFTSHMVVIVHPPGRQGYVCGGNPWIGQPERDPTDWDACPVPRAIDHEWESCDAICTAHVRGSWWGIRVAVHHDGVLTQIGILLESLLDAGGAMGHFTARNLTNLSLPSAHGTPHVKHLEDDRLVPSGKGLVLSHAERVGYDRLVWPDI
jgi:hypothetical protein